MARDNPVLTWLDATLLHGDARLLRWEAGTFDAIFAIHVFGHMPVQAAQDSLAEALRVLRPGGRLLVVDHSWHAWAPPNATRVIRTLSFNLGLIKLRLLARE